jgi:phosphatidyl-myo-inositol dimannoside synthase
MRVLHFLPDGFGGHGGIAQFNKDLLTAVCASPLVREVVAMPRVMPFDPGDLPPKLHYDVSAISGKWRYTARSLHYALRDRRFDLILCTHINLQPMAALARAITGAPSVLFLHGIEAWQPPAKPLTALAARRADWFVGVSRVTVGRFQAWANVPGERCLVLPCCVDLGRFTPAAPHQDIIERYQLAGTRPVLSLARLAGTERSKGFDQVLAVLRSIVRQAPDVVYVIAGAGNDRARLEQMAQSLGVADRVRFTGYVQDADKVDLYRAARAFVLAGRGEGFGIVLLEAMACGVPVVASTLDGSYEAIGNGAMGIAVDPNDGDALSRAILAALQRPVGVRPAGLDHFSFAAFSERVHNLLEQTMAARQRAPR